MDYVNLGRSGLKVLRLCLGCMSYGDTSRGWHGDFWACSSEGLAWCEMLRMQ